MHNLPSGHEASVKPVGPNNTDPGCWQSFVQQCLLVTEALPANNTGQLVYELNRGPRAGHSNCTC